METMTITTYVLITATAFFLFTVLLVPRKIEFQIQKYFIQDNFLKIKTLHPSVPLSPLLLSSELPGLRWGAINFYDKENGFPVMQASVYNTGNETVTIERAKFNIGVVGRLRNRVEGHGSLCIAPWSYTVQFDPLFEGSSTDVELAIRIEPCTGIQLSFTIGHETSDVETPTLYHFHLQLEDCDNRRIISKPLTLAIPSPVRAKSFSMLEERANVIAQNATIVKAFSSFTGCCNPLTRQILHCQSGWLTANDQHYSL